MSDVEKSFPLSLGQKALWLLERMNPKEGVYNGIYIFKVRQEIDVDALETALQQLVDRHPAMRTVYCTKNGQPVQNVLPSLRVDFKEVRYDDSTQSIDELIYKQTREPFDLENNSHTRWRLFTSYKGERHFTLVLHHGCSDLWSVCTVMNELSILYPAAKHDTPACLLPIKKRYEEFVEWQQDYIKSEKGQADLKYWQDLLGKDSENINLPIDFSRPQEMTSNADACCFYPPQAVVDDIKVYSSTNRISPFVLFLGVYHLLLHKLTEQNSILIGTPTAGRDEEFAGIYGYFVSPIVTKSIFHPDLTLSQFFEQFQKHIFASLKHQDYPFSLLAESLGIQRDPSRSALFQASFTWDNANRFENRDKPLIRLGKNGNERWMIEEFDLERLPFKQQWDYFDLNLKMVKHQNSLYGIFEYNTDLFKKSTAERFGRYYSAILQAIVDQPDQKVSDLTLISEEEKSTLLYDWGRNKQPLDSSIFLTNRVSDIAKREPERIAIAFENMSVSYSELERHSSKIANYLLQRNLPPSSVIGVYLGRTPDLIAAFLGILKSGHVYLPLDPDYPSERISFILSDSKPALFLTNQRCRKELEQRVQEPYIVELEQADVQESSHHSPNVNLSKNQLAYIIYTSGSTGKPKGVLLEHKGINNIIQANDQLVSIDKEDAVLQFASCNFDGSIFEFIAALKSGAKLVMAQKQNLVGKDLVRICQNHIVTWAVLPPALLATLSPQDFPTLKVLGVAGDACSPDLAKKWSEGRTMINGYGPTESTVWATTAELDGTAEPVIGRPVSNTEVYILSKHMKIQPVGVPGELHISGEGLARGYLNQPELTEQKFIENPFSNDSNAKLYKTGDLCRYLDNGELEFLGRIDHQVKIRGFRVELGEIESLLRENNAVNDVLVIARDDFTGQKLKEKRLVAYVIKNANSDIDTNQLRYFLREKLPDYMVPSAFVVLDSFPLTPNEKIDRKALPIPSLGSGGDNNHKPPRNETERMIADVWQSCLGVSAVSIDENFFDLGGHSLLLAQVHAELPEQLRSKVSMVDMFKYPTIQALAHFIENDTEEGKVFIIPDKHAERIRLKRRLMEHQGGSQIAIVGMAGRFPGADTVEEFWQNICQKRESITFFTPEQLRQAGLSDEVINEPNYVPAKGMLDSISGFEAPFFHFTPREAQITDPQQRLFLECSWEVLEDAGCVPAEFNGRIGVFAGIGINQYLMNHLSTRPELLAKVGDYPVMIGNDKDFLSSRVAYKLNLNGPAVVIQTACSTSLVAVHTACQSLLNEECDAALAGGVSFGRLGKVGYHYQQGMIMSQDGHCRAFDEKASGTVQGQGCGIVLLKRLQDAMDNNDRIYAVISGSATNNDGSNKTGYTAPSVDGQAKAVQTAQASANIGPEHISYVEAHGTGTPIGDPIEIEALNQAFNQPSNATPREATGEPSRIVNQYCALGSVKTNIGHLDAASGIAGLIKTAKALEAKTLPPSMHYQSPNPKIDFANSPFYVNTESRPWEWEGMRYAGISSFGIGGTNAHVVLSEAPSQNAADVERPWRIVTLSARTPSALETMTERLIKHLRTRKDQSFDNICYTLQAGRTLFPYRRYLVCQNSDEAISYLSKPKNSHVISSKFDEQPRKVVFMFSGQGSQYQKMGYLLYKVEPTFRKYIDQCRDILRNKFLFLYEELTAADYRGFSNKIHQTYITQPGLFIFEYALAKMLISWGIKPDVMVGHSVGEYVAACLSEVFTLEEALELVAIRGYLIHEKVHEKGEMLSVNLSEKEARLLTHHDVDLAAVNGENRCVLSGTTKAIQYLHNLLDEQGIENRILHTSHAFHSHMMDPILERFKNYVKRRNPKAPSVAFVSSKTGNLITEQEAKSADYWTEHLRDTVNFHHAMETILSDRTEEENANESKLILEIGPGNVLTSLVKRHPSLASQDRVLATTRHALAEDVSDIEHLLKLVARLWEQGIKIEWDEFHTHWQRYRVSLPTYPFERKKYWVRPRHIGYTNDQENTLEENELEDTYEQSQEIGKEITPPRDDIEQQVWDAWSEALGRTEFGVHDDFFDLGGDSLLAVSLVDHLQRTFNIPLANHILIQQPTVADLSAYIRTNVTSVDIQPVKTLTPSPDSPLVVIQQGEKGVRPLIMVHPIGGEVFFYRDLGRYLGRKRPVYAFQAASLSGNAAPIASVHELADSYLGELANLGLKPPYYLGGSSFGGLVAYEMAQQLASQNKPVDTLVMIDTPAPLNMPKNLQDSAAILQYLLQDQIKLSLEELRELDEKAQINYVLEQAKIQGKGSALPPHLSVPMFNTWLAHQEATLAYQPQPYHSDVLFFSHTEPMENFPAKTHEPWKEFVKGKLSIHQVPGNHITMNYAPHVRTLAQHLKEALS